ncbi:MAG: DUF1080 domain-containing protein [Planctomycetaceae bacterium]|nr:DUF1080 domain-containing protein [Planctomycetaceae bacterium]
MKDILLFAGLLTAVSTPAAAQTWQPLFNGKDLTGWHTQPGGEWKVVEGTIVGTSKKSESRHGLLVSDEQYADFILRAKFRVTTGNSGLYFRSAETKTNVAIRGLQAEVDATEAVGGLYETAKRGWVRKPAPQLISRIVSHGDWVEMVVTAIGDDMTVSLNGVTVTELLGDSLCQKSGHIALQLHGGMDMHVEFKDIAILELPPERP